MQSILYLAPYCLFLSTNWAFFAIFTHIFLVSTCAVVDRLPWRALGSENLERWANPNKENPNFAIMNPKDENF